MRCRKQEHQPGQKCPAKNAKCKACHKIGHFHCVCQSKNRTKRRANLVQSPQDDDDTHIDENGVRLPTLWLSAEGCSLAHRLQVHGARETLVSLQRAQLGRSGTSHTRLSSLV